MLYVVTGPPAAGKSSWIQAHATARDIVIDLDLITRALSGPGAPAWNQDPLQLRVAHRARYAAMDEAFALRDKVDVYLIHTMPSAKALAKYKRLGARIVAVDPGREVVMQRIEAMRDPDMQRVATRWYRQRPTLSRAAMPQTSRPW
ncbi:ATP-binding protein [Streptomyces tricolor]|uniref:ATP-binding protein n=1 Tax=Streptomyces tricolor TaxID=68277 RepID=A0ABS9J839_9ACTN|nr:AAA family ATPase [Streptomyces tricolor]MCG0061727.1 ATP-binding protein [Streptomyces tricolor]